jgi:DNA repair ATPase RecN
MKALNVEQVARKNELLAELSEARDRLPDAVSGFNESLEERRRAVEQRMDRVNELLGTARDFLQEVGADPDDLEEVGLDLPAELEEPVVELYPLEDLPEPEE